MQGVRVGYVGRVFCRAQDYTAWASGRGELDLENLDHGVRAADILHGIPGQWRPTEKPSGGMPRMIGNEDCNAGKFYAPACLGHRGHLEEENIPHPRCP